MVLSSIKGPVHTSLGQRPRSSAHTNPERQRRDASVRHRSSRGDEWRMAVRWTGHSALGLFAMHYLGRCPGVAPGWFEDAPLAPMEPPCSEAQGLWHREDYGPKARFIPAWAKGPGHRHTETLSAKGAIHPCGIVRDEVMHDACRWDDN